MSVNQLVRFLRSEIQQKDADKTTADFVRRIKLSERLDDRTIEQLQGEGLGPKTVEALRTLAATSGGLPAPPPPAPPTSAYVQPPPPSAEDQKRILSEVTDYAQNYTKKLPDFICSQVTRRYVDPTGKESWQQQDTVLERLTYFEGREDYKVVTVNNKPVEVSHQKLGGAAVSEGEFGSILAEIFDPRSETTFGWARWTTWHGRRTYVFTYRVPQPRSTYRITQMQNASGSDKVSAVAGYHGLVYVDTEFPQVMRIVLETEGLPPDFPIKEVNLNLTYNNTKIGDSEFMLPERAELRSRDDRNVLVKNDLQFVMYRKFGADTTIQFDTPPPLPDEKEQPLK
jgi:hypothetical protein